jgi:hypothetical protein
MPRERHFTRVLAEPALIRATVSAELVPIRAMVSVELALIHATASAVQVPIRGPSARNHLRVQLQLSLNPSLQP